MLQPERGMRQRLLRCPIQVPVLFKRLDRQEPAQTGNGWTEDLGEGGACLKLPTPLLMGCRLGLVIFTEPDVVEAEARVLWVRPGGHRAFYFHGVEFLNLTPAYYEALLKALAPEKCSEKRGYHRFPLSLRISCQAIKTDTPPLEGQIGNISRGGAMIFLPEQLLPHTEVEITLVAPRTERILGKVRWVLDSKDDFGLFGHGIEFLQGPLENERFLSLFSDALAEESSDAHAAEREPA
ncbi:MAG: PilZ domain-containing protein [Candidatus Methylomirabilales bacterium]